MYSMVIQLKTILGPPEGFPRSSRWLPRVRNPAQVPPQWPTVAPPPGPHLLAKTDRSSPPLYTMHYLTTLWSPHSSLSTATWSFTCPAPPFLYHSAPSIHCGSWLKCIEVLFSEQSASLIIWWLCHLPTQFRALIGTSRRPTPGLARAPKILRITKTKTIKWDCWRWFPSPG